MKRIISLILASILSVSALFCLAGCSVNDSEVSIIWSEGDWSDGEGKATIPNSLINDMDRAMYIKKVDYKHYGANGDAKTQLDLVNKVLGNGCQVLVVELVAGSDKAQEIVDAAEAEDVPVIFFNCDVDDTIIDSYDKCFIVKSDIDTIVDVQGKLIADYVKDNFKDIDKNEDNKITAITYKNDDINKAAIKKANELLATDDYQVSRNLFGEKINLTIDIWAGTELKKSELVLTANDTEAYNALAQLQAEDYNTDKLSTHFVPIITVGENLDYKAIVLAMGEDKYEDNKYLVDLTSVKAEDLDDMIYTTINVIDAGRIAGTATEDLDSIALAVAQIVRNVCKGNDATKDVASDSVVVDGNIVKVSYIPYTK